jgi:hypothetical protein
MCLALTEAIVAAKDVILAIAGATTAIVAVRGLNTWNRQLRGTADFDAARSLAKCTYRLRDKLQACRSPMIWAREFPPEYREAGFKKSVEQEAGGYAFVYVNRLSSVWEALQDFDTSTLEAEALWGIEVRTATDQLRAVLRKVNTAIDAVVHNVASGGQDFSTDRDFGKEMRAAVSATPSQADNSINMALQAAVEGIDALLRPHLQRGG